MRCHSIAARWLQRSMREMLLLVVLVFVPAAIAKSWSVGGSGQRVRACQRGGCCWRQGVLPLSLCLALCQPAPSFCSSFSAVVASFAPGVLSQGGETFDLDIVAANGFNGPGVSLLSCFV